MVESLYFSHHIFLLMKINKYKKKKKSKTPLHEISSKVVNTMESFDTLKTII